MSFKKPEWPIDSKCYSKEQHLAGMEPGEGPAKCTWTPTSTEKCPHTSRPAKPRPKICETILDNIGNTPLVRINTITKEEGIECELLAKCEFFNAGGSVKDRIGKRMVEDAEAAGRITPGVSVLIEPTSGNTGIGIALAGAVRGYRCIITMPEKMSSEKVDVLKALGAEIIRTPTEAAWDAPESHISVALRLEKEIPNAVILDQYSNPSNPMAHYDGTAEELLAQCDGKIDTIVMSAGTGGTIAGTARKLREKLPNVRIVGVDPYGSILALPQEMNPKAGPNQVEGIGYDFIPKVIDRTLIDDWIKTDDAVSFPMSRRLIKSEGLLCGGSSGSAMWAALRVAKTMKKGERCVVLLADSVRNYMTKFLNDGWMIENGYMQKPAADAEWWSNKTVSDLKLASPLTVSPDVTVADCISVLREAGVDQLPVVGPANEVVGMVTLGTLTSKLLSKRVESCDAIADCMFKNFQEVKLSTELSELQTIFDRHHFALVVTTQKVFNGKDSSVEKSMVFGVVTPIDLTHYIVSNEPPSPKKK